MRAHPVDILKKPLSQEVPEFILVLSSLMASSRGSQLLIIWIHNDGRWHPGAEGEKAGRAEGISGVQSGQQVVISQRRSSPSARTIHPGRAGLQGRCVWDCLPSITSRECTSPKPPTVLILQTVTPSGTDTLPSDSTLIRWF